ncbi:MAG: tetratricopeptide repeat protein [Candidatus Thorarchaeota archaeon]
MPERVHKGDPEWDEACVRLSHDTAEAMRAIAKKEGLSFKTYIDSKAVTIVIDPRDPLHTDPDFEELIAKVSSLRLVERFDESLELIDEGMKIYIDSPQLLRELGIISKRLGDVERAKQSLWRSFELEPNDPLTIYEYAGLLAYYGNLEKALELWIHQARITPYNVDMWYNIGCTFRDIGKYDESKIAFKQLLEIDKNCVRGWNAYASLLILLDDYKDAEKACRRAIELDSEDFTAWTNHGTVLYNQGRYKAALKAWRRAVKINPGCAYAWANLAVGLRDTGRTSEAEAAMKQANELEPAISEYEVVTTHGGWGIYG